MRGQIDPPPPGEYCKARRFPWMGPPRRRYLQRCLCGRRSEGMAARRAYSWAGIPSCWLRTEFVAQHFLLFGVLLLLPFRGRRPLLCSKRSGLLAFLGGVILLLLLEHCLVSGWLLRTAGVGDQARRTASARPTRAAKEKLPKLRRVNALGAGERRNATIVL
eukprot:9486341-Pyramimonas_sp.AAC.2